MKETITTCDACGKKLETNGDLLIYGEAKVDYDLCLNCGRGLIRKALESIVLRKNCEGCGGKGKIRIIDEERTYAEASCGENRTQYKTIECDNCFHGN